MLPKPLPHPVRDHFEDRSGDVLVAVGHRRIRPTHHVLRCSLCDAELQKHRRRRVPGVMKAGVPNSRSGEKVLPPLEVGTVVERPTCLVREQPAAVDP